jgi:hypothetical protein
VIIPSQLDVSSGEHYGGSPFLGLTGTLPQGHPGLNTTGGYYHMFHSHNEKEVTTDDIFPGGMMTMLIIEPWSVDLDAGTVTGGGSSGGFPLVAVTGELGTGALNPAMTTLTFGNFTGSTTRTNTVTFTNNGTASAILGQAAVVNTAGSGFSLGSVDTCSGVTLPIAGACQISVNFNPTGTTTKTGTLTVPVNGNGSAILNLTGS